MSAEPLNILFLFFCIVLVFLMQIGFLCLEAGAVRSKNSINVATKNLLDLIIVTLLYVFVGFYIQYGSFQSLVDRAEYSEGYLYLFLIFQALFAATATTIVSGAVAERCGLKGYLAACVVITLLIYPVAGQWVWGGTLGTEEGWLARLGFVDFAGSTVVHCLGGSVALAAVIIIGPREGAYESAERFQGQNFVLSLMGVLLLWLGWFGFNLGSLLTIKTSLPLVLINTFVAGAAGGFAGLLWSFLFKKSVNLPIVANALLAGLVAITAGAHAVTLGYAVIIGLIGGWLCAFSMRAMDWFKLDDVISAVPVHLVAGIWGTVAVGLFGSADILGTGHTFWTQLGIQAFGSLIVVAWSFGVGFGFLLIINHFIPLRVSKEAEIIGLNTAEHGSVSEMSHLANQLEVQSYSGQFKPVDIDAFSDLSTIAQQYNAILHRFMHSQALMRENIETLESTRKTLHEQKDHAEKANAYKSQFLAKMSHELRTPLNGIIGAVEVMADDDMPTEHKSLLNLVRESSTSLLHIVNDVLDFSALESGQLKLAHRPYDPHLLFEQCLSIFMPETLERPIELSLDVPQSFPSELMGDASRIKQAVIALLSNAFKFTEKGFIRLSAQYDYMTETVTLKVSDSGKGISEDRLKAIFESFQQEDNSTSRQFGGSGLGLSIANQLVALMGGQMGVDSQPGEGSTFYFHFKATSQLKI